MNRIFKSVWSEALGAWVAASEKCRGRGKGGAKVARAVLLAVGLSVAGGAFADLVLDTIFGVDVRMDGLSAKPRLAAFDAKAELHGLRHQGKQYRVSNQGIHAM